MRPYDDDTRVGDLTANTGATRGRRIVFEGTPADLVTRSRRWRREEAEGQKTQEPSHYRTAI